MICQIGLCLCEKSQSFGPEKKYQSKFLKKGCDFDLSKCVGKC